MYFNRTRAVNDCETKKVHPFDGLPRNSLNGDKNVSSSPSALSCYLVRFRYDSRRQIGKTWMKFVEVKITALQASEQEPQ